MKEKKVSIANGIYCLAWFFYFSYYILFEQTGLNIYYSNIINLIISCITVILLAFKLMFVDGYNLKKIFMLGLIITLALIVTKKSNNNYMLVLLLFLMSFENVDFDIFIKYDFKLRSAIFLLILILCFAGVVNNNLYIINGTQKYSFGFSHPNTFVIYFISLILEYLFIHRKKKFKFKTCFIILIFVFFISLISKARSSIYPFVIFFILYTIIKNKNYKFSKHKKISTLLVILPFLLTFLSFYLVGVYNNSNNSLIYSIDKIMTYRISSAAYFFNNYKLTMFGNKMLFLGGLQASILHTNLQLLDMGYLRLALNYGIVTLSIFLLILSFIQYKSIKMNNYELLFINTLFISIGFSEVYIYLFVYNIALLSLYNLLKIKNNYYKYWEICYEESKNKFCL